MKIDIDKYYVNKGYKSAYLITDKDGRNDVHLIHNDKSRKCISYAKYLYESYYKTDVPVGYEVDHIDNDYKNDKIENLQLLKKGDNIRKRHSLHPRQYVTLICPICGKEFQFEKRNLSTHPNPCCSRRCGGIKSHLF